VALQAGTTLRNAWLDAIETVIGTSMRLKMFSGSVPSNCGVADSGTLLVDITCPSDYLNAASGGTKTLLGTWSDTSADNTGTAGYFRCYSSALTCHLQGTISVTGGGGDMQLTTTSIVAGGTVTVTSFTITAPNP
jgi:hypothetical protein